MRRPFGDPSHRHRIGPRRSAASGHRGARPAARPPGLAALDRPVGSAQPSVTCARSACSSVGGRGRAPVGLGLTRLVDRLPVAAIDGDPGVARRRVDPVDVVDSGWHELVRAGSASRVGSATAPARAKIAMERARPTALLMTPPVCERAERLRSVGFAVSRRRARLSHGSGSRSRRPRSPPCSPVSPDRVATT